jgi:hypothetical protein
MRIFSPFHDYYDVGQSSGGDPKRIYNCTTEDISDNKQLQKEISGLIKGFPLVDIFLFFCNKLYVSASYSKPTYSEEGLSTYQKIEKINFDILDIDKLFEQQLYYLRQLRKNLVQSFVDKEKKAFKIQLTSLLQKDFSSIHLLTKAPIVSVRSKRSNYVIYTNPQISCKDSGIMPGLKSVLPPLEAFQLIEQFVRNELAQQLDPISKLSDEDNIIRHGMDVKKSFRKVPR